MPDAVVLIVPITGSSVISVEWCIGLPSNKIADDVTENLGRYLPSTYSRHITGDENVRF